MTNGTQQRPGGAPWVIADRSTRHAGRPTTALLLASACVIGAASLIAPSFSFAQSSGTSTEPVARHALPLADPVLDNDAEIKGNKAVSWSVGNSRLVFVEGDIRFTMGTYGFRADRAVVRIDTEVAPGRKIRHLSLYLDNVKPLRGRGPVQAEAPRLLVTASTIGKIDLITNLLEQKSAASDPFVVDAQRRIDDYLAAISQPVRDVPDHGPVMTPEMIAIRDERRAQIAEDIRARSEEALAAKAKHRKGGESTAIAQAGSGQTPTAGATTQPTASGTGPSAAQAGGGQTAAAGGIPVPLPTKESSAILPAEGMVSFNFDQMVVEPGKNGESTIVLLGHVRVLYQNYQGKPGASLTAERAVIFLSKDKLAMNAGGKLNAGDVHGIYLEDNVIATYDLYTVRAPRVYYDLSRNKAVILDAVLFAWDPRRNIPIYVRAEKMRQEAANLWTAQQAAVTTSEFAVPHFSIAAKQIVVKQEPNGDGTVETKFTAKDVTTRVGKQPIFWLPKMSGNANDIPLRKAEGTYSNSNGPIIKTTWDVFGLMGRERPPGVDLTANIDYLGEHGPALGAHLEYDRPEMFGEFNGYLVGLDDSEDKIGNRKDVSFDHETRGFAHWQHRQMLAETWELSLEAAYVSDPTFLEEFFRSEADEAKPYETSVYIKKQENDWAFTFLAKYDLQDFQTQTTQLQSPGYSVDKAPELGYYRVATSLWDDRLTYYTETRASRVRIRAGEDTPAERGFTPAQSLALFGIPDTSEFSAMLTPGTPSDYRLRLDSRHEIDMPLTMGIFDVTPYIAGRFTGYDDDFEKMSGEDDRIRGWGSVGVKLSTELSRTYDDVDVAIFDLHRLRHIIEPHANLFYSGSTIEMGDLPIYDPDIEGITDGAGVSVGATNTLQTQRGGPGRWRSVDWLVVNTDFFFRGDDGDTSSPIGRFIDYRPEYSLGGDHFHADAMWQVSDTLAVVGEIIQDLEDGKTAQWRLGVNMQHTPYLATFIDYTDTEVLDSRLLSFGFTYQLTRKYTVSLRQTVDVATHQARSLDISINRRLPRWELIVIAQFDQVDDDQTIGVVLIPHGVTAARLIDPFSAFRNTD